MKLSWIIITVFVLTGCSSNSPVNPPTLKFNAPTRQETSQLAIGTGYHDKQQYDKAINHYQSLLKNNPNNATVLYEMALTYYAKNDYLNSLHYAKAAANFNSPFLPSIYLLMGLNYKRMNRPDQAIEVYRFATKQFKTHIDLHYQLAATYLILNDPGSAAESFKKTITLDPYHHDSYFQLGMAYYFYDYKTPAFLSLMTFLLLQPDSKRSSLAISLIDDIFKSGVAVDEKTKAISLAVNLNPKTDEGDFQLLDIAMSTRRIELLTSGKNIDEQSIKREQIKSYLLTLSQIKKPKNGKFFIQRHLFPFYKQIYLNNMSDTLFYYTHQSANDRKINTWINNNRTKVNQLKSKLKNFKWQSH